MSWLEYLPLLAATILIELGVIEILRQLSPPAPRRSDIVWVNLATHPIAYVLIGWMPTTFVPVELGVILMESLGYRWLDARLSTPRAVTIAFTANAVTALIAWLMV